MTLDIRKATLQDMDWVNAQYDHIDFVPSKFNSEFIAIAESDGEKSGLGRLVNIDENSQELGGMYVLEAFRGKGIATKLVQHLLEHCDPKKNTYCLPFAHLAQFYKQFGFSDCKVKAPEEILRKRSWCNSTYEGKTLLFYLERKSF